MKKYKAVIYDLDGTLIDTAYMNIKPLQIVLEKQANIKKEYEELLPYFCYTGEGVMKEFGIEDRMLFYSAWVNEMNNGSYQSFAYEGIEETMAGIDELGIRQAVVSSKYRSQYQIDIEKKGLGKHFECVILAEDCNKHKPDPEPMIRCLDKMKLHTNEVIYVGDTDNDCRCAKRAGVAFAYASWGPLSLKEREDYYLSEPSDIKRLVEGSFSEIVVAGGCFWGVQEYYRRLKGVIHTEVGYAQGHVEKPAYEEVKTGTTNHAEVCKIMYDETKISLNQILDHLFRMIDPTSLNKQGEDEGTQYRTGVYYINKNDKETIETFIKKQQSNYEKPITVEIEALKEFYTAEEYHQKYLQKNMNGYCHVNFSHIKKEELK